MKKIMLTFFLMIGLLSSSFGQTYFTEKANITFSSTLNKDTIVAVSNSASFQIDLSTNKIEVNAPIKDFSIKHNVAKALAGQNLMEADKFPVATFKGKMANGSMVDLNKTGSYMVEVVGLVTIHGATQKVQMPAVFNVRNGKVEMQLRFYVPLKELKLKLPAPLLKKLNDKLKVGITVDLKRK